MLDSKFRLILKLIYKLAKCNGTKPCATWADWLVFERSLAEDFLKLHFNNPTRKLIKARMTFLMSWSDRLGSVSFLDLRANMTALLKCKTKSASKLMSIKHSLCAHRVLRKGLIRQQKWKTPVWWITAAPDLLNYNKNIPKCLEE